MSKGKMKNVIIHLKLFRFEVLIKTQAKYHLLASQPSVWCCKFIVIKGPGKFLWSLQKNRTLLLPRTDSNHFSRASFNFSYVPVFTLCRPSRQILVPRTYRGCPPPTSPGHLLKILFDRLGDVPIWHPRDVPIWRLGDFLKWRPG